MHHGLDRGDGPPVLDKILEVAVLLFADRRVSREIGSCAIFSTLPHLGYTRQSILSAISSGSVRVPAPAQAALGADSLLIVSIMCTGMRIVRAWSAIARVIAWRIHHVAYVENL